MEMFISGQVRVGRPQEWKKDSWTVYKDALSRWRKLGECSPFKGILYWQQGKRDSTKYRLLGEIAENLFRDKFNNVGFLIKNSPIFDQRTTNENVLISVIRI